MPEYTPTRDAPHGWRRRRPLRPSARRRAQTLHRPHLSHPAPMRRNHRPRRLLARRPHQPLPRAQIPFQVFGLLAILSPVHLVGSPLRPHLRHRPPNPSQTCASGSISAPAKACSPRPRHRNCSTACSSTGGWQPGRRTSSSSSSLGAVHDEDAWAARFDAGPQLPLPPCLKHLIKPLLPRSPRCMRLFCRHPSAQRRDLLYRTVATHRSRRRHALPFPPKSPILDRLGRTSPSCVYPPASPNSSPKHFRYQPREVFLC